MILSDNNVMIDVAEAVIVIDGIVIYELIIITS